MGVTITKQYIGGSILKIDNSIALWGFKIFIRGDTVHLNTCIGKMCNVRLFIL